jgi:HAMP domain-containing protein
MIKKLKLGAKINLILLIAFLIVILISGSILSNILQQNAEQTIESKALILMEAMSSVRDYTTNEVNPELVDRLDTEDQFIRPTVPGYSARQVFENLRQREQYNDFFYKEATLNPTNLRDKADKFETTLVEKFRREPELKELSGFRSQVGGDLFYVSRPLKVSEESCLRCHSIPENAPKSQLATYGKELGFGWKLNEIVGAQIISVPAGTVLADAQRLQVLVIGILIVGFLVAAALLNFFIRISMIQPLVQMAKWSREVSTGALTTDFEHQSQDEIGILANSVNRLKVSLEMAMNMLDQPPSDPL